jgi:hypothetical protein
MIFAKVLFCPSSNMIFVTISFLIFLDIYTTDFPVVDQKYFF